MKAAFLQYNPGYLAVEENLDYVASMLEDVDADLIVLPELFASGYFFKSGDDVARVAEEIPDGPTTQRLEAWARAGGYTLVAGLPEKAGSGYYYNSAVIVDPEGYRATYRKVHLYYEEKRWFSPGDLGFVVLEATTRDGDSYRLGTMICFDWYYPESARSLALKGADVIAHPANLVRPDCPRAMPIRALENHVFIITANRYGLETNGDRTLVFIGQSEICDPRGHILVRAAPVEDRVAVVEFDPLSARDRQLTTHNDLFSDRRPEAYIGLG